MSNDGAPNFKATLNLPTTRFPMRGNLPGREPEMLATWAEERVYERVLEARATSPRFLLHDGPPYANGNIHIGHALNKIIKDIIVKYKTMHGYLAPYVPGWDCHGLPIELEVEKKLGKAKKAALGKVEVRRLCREYATRFVDVQRKDFERLGVFGDWANPYLTMRGAYSARELRELATFAANGDLYRGKKPVHWCASCQTALAEAEVEYKDASTDSIYVAFPLVEPYPAAIPDAGGRAVAAVIWTTTPWTLPANLAIAAHPDFEYALVEGADGNALLVARELLPRLAALVGETPSVLGTVTGRDLEGVRARHPWIDRESPVILGEHVTLEAGTGLVHTAPGHGQDDYEVGLRYGLDVYNPVDDRGRFVADLAEFGGLGVFDANPRIIEHLRGQNRLLGAESMSHSYPHCWRCRNPVIFRATEQWFISMEKTELRARALDAIDRVTWIPEWGRERIRGMVRTRPDWCISRQRAWGVPIVAVRCQTCDEVQTSAELLRHVADVFAEETADAWFARPVDDLLPEGYACRSCGSTTLAKEEDILDVWFDSGVSFSAVVEERADLGGHADIYVEGSDQHRGWFQSALLTSVATRGEPPFGTVLTHGFILADDGRKMSKSLGNVISPQEVVKKHGADILRLWVASEDYRNDIRISQEIIGQAVDAYRRIRNTARFLLGNLADFDPSRDRVEDVDLLAIDRFALDRLQQLVERCQRAYDDYEFHLVYHALNNFCSVDLSSLYLDIAKDRLYCEAAESSMRRSGQTALYAILDGMVRLMAPILSFTAEDIWRHMPADPARPASVHGADFPIVEPARRDPQLAKVWDQLIEVRAAVTKTLEGLRQSGEIKHSLEAHVVLAPTATLAPLLAEHADQLADLLIVSRVELVSADSLEAPVLAPGVAVVARRALGVKCPRCWNYRTDGGADAAFPDLCARCAGVIAATGAVPATS